MPETIRAEGRRDTGLRSVVEYALIIVGAALNAVAIVTLLLPNEVVAGGVTGLAVIADLSTPIPFGVALLVMNLPLVWVQWRYLGGARFVARTIVGVVALSAFTELLAPILPPITHDRLLTVVYGGVLGGLGLAMVFHGRGTTGGADILGRLCHRYFGWSIGRTLLGMNVLVYGLAAFLYGAEPAMLALLLSYVMSQTLDTALHGMSGSRAVWIVSERPDAVTEVVTRAMGRGLTAIAATGGHSGQDKAMLYAVVPRADIQRLKLRVLQCDPAAFITVLTPRESVGGFQLANPQ
ncbi:MAG: YitT family protein [Candidatus Krumholzibacteriia bacterium]